MVIKQEHFFFILVLKIRLGKKVMNRFSSPLNHKNRALYERFRLRATPRHGMAVSFLKSQRSAAGAPRRGGGIHRARWRGVVIPLNLFSIIFTK